LKVTTVLENKSRRSVAGWFTVSLIASIFAISSWAVSSPVGSSPDDDFHLPSIWCGQGIREDLCEVDDREGWYQIPLMTMANSSCFAFAKEVSGVCHYDNSLAGQFHLNLSRNLYPPAFYWTMSWMASPDIPTSTILMRVFNGLFSILLMVLLLVALPKHFRRAPFLALVVTFVPLAIFLTSSTNPSGWSYIGLLVLFAAFSGFLTADDKMSKTTLGILAGFGFLIALGSRADSTFFALFAVFLSWVLVGVSKHRSRTNIVFTILLVITSVIFYFLGSTARSVISGAGLSFQGIDRPAPNLFANITQIPELWAGVFGTWGLGWLDTPMPAIVWFSTLSIYAGLVFLAISAFSFKQSIAFALSLLALTAVPMYILTTSGLYVGEQVQPRYLLPLLVFAVFTAVYRNKDQEGFHASKGQLFLAAAALTIAHAVALHTNLRRYTTGLDVLGANLETLIEWWWTDLPISPNTVFILGSLAFALFLLSVWKLRIPLGLTKQEATTEQSR
jgi:hypothetical protein